MMAAAEIVSALGGRNGMARCPVHADKTPSLSVSDGENGRVLVRCHAGCAQSEVIGALKQRGLWPNGSTSNGTAISATYDYRDERGELLFQVCRMIPKDFRQRRPDGNGGWVWRTKGVRKVPYRLFELQAKVAHDTILIVEGEKDVDRLAELGFVATCNAGGAGKWQDEISQYFASKTVYILSDNDEPGAAHARDVAEKLAPLAREVRVVELPGLPDKGDVSDWLANGGDHRTLIDLCLAAPVWGTQAENTTKPGPAFKTVGDLRNIPPPAWNVDGLLQENSTAVMWGLPGSYKTTHQVDLWASTAVGRPWAGRGVKPGISLYIPLEDLPGFRARVDAWEEHHRRALPDHCLWWSEAFDFSEACLADVAAAMEQLTTKFDLPIRNLTIDPIMKGFGEGSAMDEEEMRKRVIAVEKLRAPHPAATAILSQHCSWAADHEFGSIMQRALTATSIRARGQGEIGTLEIVRQKNAREGDKLIFKRRDIGPDGKIALEPSTEVDTAALTGEERKCFDALVKAVDDAQQAGQNTLPSLSALLSARVRVDRWQREFKRMKSDGPDTKPDSILRAWRRHRNSLEAAGKIGVYDDYAWIIYKPADKADKGADKGLSG